MGFSNGGTIGDFDLRGENLIVIEWCYLCVNLVYEINDSSVAMRILRKLLYIPHLQLPNACRMLTEM